MKKLSPHRDQGAGGDAQGVLPPDRGGVQRDGGPARMAHLGRGVDAQRRRDCRGPGQLTGGFYPGVVRNRTETENLVSVWGADCTHSQQFGVLETI